MGTPGQNVRRLIRTARERKGDWSQADLARRARVSRGSVQSLENGVALKEGKESAIETALGLPLGSIEDVRSGRISIEQALENIARPAVSQAPPADLPSIAAEIEYFRNLLGSEDFARMFALIDALYHERRQRELSSQDGAESDQLDDTG